MPEFGDREALNAYPLKYCPNSPKGHANGTQNRFCIECGSRLIPHEVCEKCRNHVAPWEKFCGQCGELVTVYERVKA